MPRTPSPSRLAVAAVVLAVAVAGCLGATQDADPADAAGAGPPTEDPAAWAADALRYGDGHDHTDPSDHQGQTTSNFETVAWNPLIGNYTGNTPRGNLCGDLQQTEDGRELAAVESRGDIVFSLVDVTDQQNPVKLGEFIMRTTYVYDMAVVPDGDHVVLTTSNPKTPHKSPADDADAKAPIAWRSPCTGGEAVPLDVHEWSPMSNQVILVNIEDPSNPTVVDSRPIPGLGHSIWSGNAADRTWVTAATWAATSATSNFEFYNVVPDPSGGKRLRHLSTWTMAMSEDAAPENLTRYVGHNEVEVHEHPVTGQTIAYLALWNHGAVFLDMEDPRNPERIGQWDDYDPQNPEDGSGSTHEAIPIGTTWNGRHYTVMGPEIVRHPPNTPTGVVRVLDTTDPSNPRQVGAWTLPHDIEWNAALQWSTHYIEVAEQTLFVSMYHGGVWAVDLSPIAEGEVPAEGPPAQLHTSGVYAPARESPQPPDDPFRWTPTMEEVHDLEDGGLVTWSSNSGLYTFEYDASNPMPAPEPWSLEETVPLSTFR